MTLTRAQQQRLWEWEEKHYDTLSPRQKREYQAQLAAVGGHLLPQHTILMPLCATPFWLLGEDPYRAHQSLHQLPAAADVVIIGCGLTGASAFYHLRKSKLSVLLLEESDVPCAQSSGKNGGNFQLLAESYIGTYDGIVGERAQVIRTHFPHLSDAQVHAHALRDAHIINRFTRANVTRIEGIVRQERIECDYSPAGWLQLASDPHEEAALATDAALLGADSEYAEPDDVAPLWNGAWRPSYRSRWIFRSGNYHPVKFVRGLLSCTLPKPKKWLMTQTRVQEIRGTTVVTNRGTVKAGRIIVATNAFTPLLLPAFQGVITCLPSQIVNLEHVPQALRGATVTERAGEIYYNVPQSTVYHRGPQAYGMLHYGTDWSHGVPNPYRIRRNPRLFHEMLKTIQERFPTTRHQPPSRCWAGPLAMTSDRTPILGQLNPHTFLAVAFNGFGGSWCIEAGYLAAQGHELSPEEQSVFSPHRFFTSSQDWRRT